MKKSIEKSNELSEILRPLIENADDFVIQNSNTSFCHGSEPVRINFLLALWAFVRAIPNTIQNRICEECNWSIPTFHRRMQTFKDEKTKSIRSLSNAEKSKVAEVVLDVLGESTLFAADMIKDASKYI